jgi:hypothetical protein
VQAGTGRQRRRSRQTGKEGKAKKEASEISRDIPYGISDIYTYEYMSWGRGLRGTWTCGIGARK